MKTEYIKTITFREFTNIILDAKEELIISMPNIHKEICEALLECKKKNLADISLIIDNSEDNYRNGYGNIHAIARLKYAGIRIYNIPRNFVSFIISGKTGWYIFPQSRIFTGDDELGLNAALINPIDVLLLKRYYLNDLCYEEEYEGVYLESLTKAKEDSRELLEELDIKAPVELEELKTEEIKEVMEKLRQNPPADPDLKRKITTYTAKIQFVELSYSGGNLKDSRIKIPKEALPIIDKEFKRKLIASLRLFDEENPPESLEIFKEFKYRVDELRSRFLVSIASRKGKCIIRIEQKDEFLRTVESLNKEFKRMNTQLCAILDKEIEKAKQKIYKYLNDYFEIKDTMNSIINEQKSFFGTYSPAARIMSKIQFPKPESILGKLKLTVNFYDLTWQDFSDSKLLEEFRKKGIMESSDINDIVKFTTALALKEQKNDTNISPR